MWKMDEKETKRVMTAGLLGLAVGDAIGVPVEFLDRRTVQMPSKVPVMSGIPWRRRYIACSIQTANVIQFLQQ